MRVNIVTFGLVGLATLAAALPVPQGAGVGAGCDAILSDADTGTGLAVKEAGNNAASLVTSTGAKRLVRRQGAGVGAGCNSVASDADTGTGLAVKEAGNNAASLVQSTGARRRQLTNLPGDATSEVTTVTGDVTGDVKTVGGQVGTEVTLTSDELKIRQLDKAGAGVAAVVNVADPTVANDVTAQSDTLDGDGTSDSALVGQQVGATEVQTGTEAGNLVPSNAKNLARRQLDKAGAGVAAVVNVADPTVANDVTAQSDTIDGDGTSDSALVGQQVGATEVQTGTEAGNLVPSNAKNP